MLKKVVTSSIELVKYAWCSHSHSKKNIFGCLSIYIVISMDIYSYPVTSPPMFTPQAVFLNPY